MLSALEDSCVWPVISICISLSPISTSEVDTQAKVQQAPRMYTRQLRVLKCDAVDETNNELFKKVTLIRFQNHFLVDKTSVCRSRAVDGVTQTSSSLNDQRDKSPKIAQGLICVGRSFRRCIAT